MRREQQMVRDFHIAMGNEIAKIPTHPGNQIKQLRLSLIREELYEFELANTITDHADAIGDLLYVVLGTAIEYGIDIQPIFDEIHRSNMTKFIDGYKRADGKWIKGPSYSPANLFPIIKNQYE